MLTKRDIEGFKLFMKFLVVNARNFPKAANSFGDSDRSGAENRDSTAISSVGEVLEVLEIASRENSGPWNAADESTADASARAFATSCRPFRVVTLKSAILIHMLEVSRR